MIQYHTVRQISLPQHVWSDILQHCRRKLAGDFLPDESPVRRAFGIVVGRQAGDRLLVQRVIPMKRNARDQEPLKTFMDRLMEEHAIPSTTPMDQRGWVTDPQEFKHCLDLCTQEQLTLFGAYHIHVVPWPGDSLRDTPTGLDAVLVKGSKMYTFIISLVDPEQPIMRAFYEGKLEEETPICFEAHEAPAS